MKGILIFIARILVSFTFLYSGFVKLVDPLGSSYKFEEYFGADVLNLEFLIPFALPFSILLILVEIMLGLTLLLGYKPKITVWSLLAINTLFLFLTWYSAYYNKVTDCGCFGDALKLSPWDTFYKNVILLVLMLPLLLNTSTISSVFSDKIMRNISIASLGIFIYITYFVLAHLPIIDFRAYAIGKNIEEGMEYQDGSDELPPVHDFFLESDTDDLTDQILNSEKAMLIVSYEIEQGNAQGFEEIREMATKAIEKGYMVYGVSASSSEGIQEVMHRHELPFEFLFCDGTTLKTIIRANPGVVTLEKGTVVGKWNWRDAASVFE
ncbi:DoxX family protein [Flavicella sp.]|uniref:DoxX family protein n=1 Tax=Flavicella sp. TaxID=2957742 RepID=UPI00260B7671|nr:DoxX family protein [Flavicella sp.]MDG1806191.1 DoxX family protein [Flavicella sp.]